MAVSKLGGWVHGPVAVVVATALSGCLHQSLSFVAHPDAERPAVVSAQAAATKVTAFRTQHGLGPVSVDASLGTIAAGHARGMADADRLTHVLPGEGSFETRLRKAGYWPAIAVENIGAGYHDLDEAMAGWIASPSHRRNLLDKDVTRIGIAVAYNPDGKFHDYWTLILAAPKASVPPGATVTFH
jgi:uncharacterized protein YkwD